MNPSHYQILPSGCWKWLLSVNRDGYGQVAHGKPKKMLKAHRLAYEIRFGPIPNGKVLDHLCRNRWCVNAEHLEPVTDRVNVVERGQGITALNVRKKYCPRGHAYLGSNLLVITRKDGRQYRSCRICALARTRDWKHRLKLKGGSRE